MANKHIAIAEDWLYRRVGDEGGVAYHPYTGDIHAVTELPAQLLASLAESPMAHEACVAAAILKFPDEDPDELRAAANSHLTALIELGAISELGLHGAHA